jgi:hypothetical protein
MPTDTSWLSYLLAQKPGYAIRNDTPDVLALVQMGYLERHGEFIDWLGAEDVLFTLTDAGARLAASDPDAKKHSEWRAQLRTTAENQTTDS